MKRFLLALAVACVLAGCSKTEPAPVPIDTKSDQCAFCRMAVSEPRFASEIVSSGEEPRIFDDLGCLRGFLKVHPLAPGAVVFVTDHRTAAFVRASGATFTSIPTLATPMESHLIAHADPASRDTDPGVPHGSPVDVAEILGR